MHSEETVLQSASPCKVVSISDFEGSRKERIEEWLKKEMEERYGEFDSVLDNPLLRISTKFDALSAESQVTLFGFAKGYVLGPGGGISLRDQLWSILEAGRSAAWEAVEEYADSLLIKEKTYNGRTGVSADGRYQP